MIPYDELVIALQTWRARQGLSVGQAAAPPVAAAPSARTPVTPPRGQAHTPPPLAPADEYVDEGALVEEGYNAGGEYGFGGGGDDATAIGDAIERASEPTLDEPALPPRGRNRNNDW